jgi:MoaA/NifB/PqqE/SkfB family radical SAM enzyme
MAGRKETMRRNEWDRSSIGVKNRFAGAVHSLRLVNPGAWVNAALNCLEGAIRTTRPRSYPIEVDIILTKACNLRCTFCISYASLREERWLPFERYERVAEALFPYARGVFFCSGGEPFLYPKIRESLRIVRNHRAIATVTSNGMLINKEVADWIVDDQTIFELFISFDGATKASLEQIRRGASFETILANVAYLNRLKRDRRRRFPQLSMRNDIDFDESLFNHLGLAREVFARARVEARRFGVQLDLPALPDGKRRERNCVYPWRFCQIDTDGSVRFCYHSWRQRLGFFEDGFDSIWRGMHYQKVRGTIRTKVPYYPHCEECAVRRGAGLAKSHKADFTSNSYVIPGLEHLQVPFNDRSMENLTSLRERKLAHGDG